MIDAVQEYEKGRKDESDLDGRIFLEQSCFCCSLPSRQRDGSCGFHDRVMLSRGVNLPT